LFVNYNLKFKEKEIKEAFDFYDTEKNGLISRGQLKSILGNFGFQNQNAKEIEQELEEKNDYDSSKQTFTFTETIEIIARKWFFF
jgi:Ca2+-binding EF-hand superfamily protein